MYKETSVDNFFIKKEEKDKKNSKKVKIKR